MGEMVMNTGKQNKQARFVTLSVALFFVLSAITFMNFLYCLSDCIGSAVSGSPDSVRMVQIHPFRYAMFGSAAALIKL